jgi:hypothetical protein
MNTNMDLTTSPSFGGRNQFYYLQESDFENLLKFPHELRHMAIFIGNVPMAEKIWKIHSDCAKSQRDETEFPFIVSDNLENMPEVIPVFDIESQFKTLHWL